MSIGAIVSARQLGWRPGKTCPTCGDEFDAPKQMKIHHYRSHGRTLHDNVCRYCGDVIQDRRARQFCNNECKGKAMRNVVRAECAFCGSTFERRRSWVERQRERGYRLYCSPIHQREAQRYRLDCTHRRPNRIERPYLGTIELLHELYVIEDRTIAETARRVPDFGYDAVRKRLIDFGFYDPDADAPLARRMETSLTWDDVDTGSETPDGDDSWRQFYRRDEQ